MTVTLSGLDMTTASGSEVTSIVLTHTGPDGGGTETITDLTSPITVTLNDLTVGAYTFTAIAYGSNIASGGNNVELFVSAPVSVTVVANTVAAVDVVLAQVAPTITGIGVSTETPTSGEAISLTATVTTLIPSSELTYRWTSSCSVSDATTGGEVFSAPTSLTTNFTSYCTGVDTITFTVTASSAAGGFTSSLSVTIPYTPEGLDITLSFHSFPDILGITANGNTEPAFGGTVSLAATIADYVSNDKPTIAWTDNCGGTFANGNTLTPTWTAPATAPTGTTPPVACNLTLSVTDGLGGTNSGWMTVHVGPPPITTAPPPATAGVLAGTEWRFVVLSAGAGSGWQQGDLWVAESGKVTFTTGAPLGAYGGSLNYADNLGNTVPPSGFLPYLYCDSLGNVKDSVTLPVFTGNLGMTNQNIIVMTANLGTTQSLAILVKHSPSTVFYPGNSNANDGTSSNRIPCDICGFGSGTNSDTACGPRKVVWEQITAGPGTATESYEEWGFAVGEIGQSPQIIYGTTSGGVLMLPYFTAYSGEPRPGWKDDNFMIDSNGVVSETVGIAPPNPVFLFTNGFMSDDKTLIIGVGLSDDGSYDPTGFSGVNRYALRVYQVTNLNSNGNVPNPNQLQPYCDIAGLGDTIQDLAGYTSGVANPSAIYSFRKLVVGNGSAQTGAASAWGSFTVSGAGAVSYQSYADSTGSTTDPAGFALSMYDWGLTGCPQSYPVTSSTTLVNDYTNQAGSTAAVDQFWGVLYDTADPSLYGKVDYVKDMFIFTKTEPSGLSSFTIAVK